MEKIQLEISLSDDELKTAMSRYHYEDADFLLFSQVYVEIMERLRPVGMYVYGPFRQEFPEADEETGLFLDDFYNDVLEKILNADKKKEEK